MGYGLLVLPLAPKSIRMKVSSLMARQILWPVQRLRRIHFSSLALSCNINLSPWEQIMVYRIGIQNLPYRITAVVVRLNFSWKVPVITHRETDENEVSL
jgi:hypothetical protein